MEPLLGHKRTTNAAWSRPVSDAEAHSRAGGRARCNRQRELEAFSRRNRVLRRYIEMNAAPGAKAQIAREFGVHRSTVTRDIQRWSGEQSLLCPTCLTPIRGDDCDRIIEARQQPHVDDPLSDAAQARRAAIKAIRAELPRVLADLNAFIVDDDTHDVHDVHDEGDDRPVYLPRVVIADMVAGVASGIAAA
jgi:hypothetical protein